MYTIYSKLKEIAEKEFGDTFPKHFHNGSDKDIKESELDEDYEKAIRNVLIFIQRKLAEYI
ncbi:MAG: hypothetical protein WA977_11920 [Halobacteriota archaeon]